MLIRLYVKCLYVNILISLYVNMFICQYAYIFPVPRIVATALNI